MLRPAALLLLSTFLLAGCGASRAEKELVMQTVRTREQALNARNLGLYLKVISTAYSDKGKGFDQVRDSLEAGFKVYEQVIYQADARKVQISGKRAEVSGTYRMKVVIRGHEMALDGKERLTLAKETDGWKIIAGL